MMDDDTIDKIGCILVKLEQRIARLEAENADIKAANDRLADASACHDQSLKNLSDRMTHESLSILDIIGDIQAQLQPVYDRVVPAYGDFAAELARFFKRSHR